MNLPSRPVLFTLLGVVLVGAILLALPWLSPARGVERAWSGVVRAIERNDRERLTAYLTDNYKDGFGLDREQAVNLIASVRGQFVACTIRRERSMIELAPDKRSAVTRALVRVEGQGTPVATAVTQASQSTQAPTEFRWRRGSWKPWDWRLVSVDNPEAARGVARFQREAAVIGL
jgi:hypothetical protein